MTSYMTNNLWRHVIPKLHQLVQLYITWHKSRDIISVRYHEMKVITPKKPGTSGSVIFGKKIQTILGTSGSVISGKIIQKWLFRVIWLEKNSFLNYRILGTELASFLEKKSRRLFFISNLYQMIFLLLRTNQKWAFHYSKNIYVIRVNARDYPVCTDYTVKSIENWLPTCYFVEYHVEWFIFTSDR